jgi:hypothetical protein
MAARHTSPQSARFRVRPRPHKLRGGPAIDGKPPAAFALYPMSMARVVAGALPQKCGQENAAAIAGVTGEWLSTWHATGPVRHIGRGAITHRR